MADIASLGSSILQAFGTYASGKQSEQAAGSEARQMRYAAGQEQAMAQRVAAEERRQARLVQSAVQARAGGDTGAGVADIYGDIAGEGEYRALAAMYEGDVNATNLRNRAAMREWEGKNAKRAGAIAATSQLLGGSASFFEKYGKGGYSYNGDAEGYRYSRTGADIRGRR